MDTKSLFKKYYHHIARQGLLKALILSATIGFGVDFVIAFVLWFTHLELIPILVITISVFVGVLAIAVPISYYKLFRPTTAQIASLIDQLGLEERMITMYEMENDESYIAMLQREDATAKLKNVASGDLKLNFPRLTFILLAVAFVCSASMITVSTLASTGNALHGGEIFAPPEEEPDDDEEEETKEYVDVNYVAGEGGFIQGEIYQRIEKGSDAEPVTATPLEGYVFVVWSDGILTAQRWDWSVSEDLTVEAQFEPAPKEETGEGDSGEDGEGEDGDGEYGEDDGDSGKDGEDGDRDGNDGEDGDGEGEAGEGDGSQSQGGPDGPGNGEDSEGSGGNSDGSEDGGGSDRGDSHTGNSSGSGASPGQNTDNNNIIDGKTDYHDAVDTEKNKQDLADDESIPPELKDILDGYFDSLNP